MSEPPAPFTQDDLKLTVAKAKKSYPSVMAPPSDVKIGAPNADSMDFKKASALLAEDKEIMAKEIAETRAILAAAQAEMAEMKRNMYRELHAVFAPDMDFEQFVRERDEASQPPPPDTPSPENPAPVVAEPSPGAD
jgi:hypothetical protein